MFQGRLLDAPFFLQFLRPLLFADLLLFGASRKLEAAGGLMVTRTKFSVLGVGLTISLLIGVGIDADAAVSRVVPEPRSSLDFAHAEIDAELVGELAVPLVNSPNCDSAERGPTFIRADGSVVVQFSLPARTEIAAWEAVLLDPQSNKSVVLKRSVQQDLLSAGEYTLKIVMSSSICPACQLKLVILSRNASAIRYCAPVSVIRPVAELD